MESSDAEEIMNMGSFEKGFKAELKARLREEQSKIILYGVAFAAGIVTGLLVTNKE